MSNAVEGLVGDLLAWLNQAERPYTEVMDAWRTSCPRMPVWEDATDRGLVELADSGGCSVVRVTPAGRAFLATRA